ncbi:divalent metal cation transporter [Candidatus Uhrbacteria bacterium]|nr:divalent metal cation transporter [Candidatus Uhrbacteria bacterium]
MTKRVVAYLKKLGPGWITGAADDDPSGIGTYTYAGSRFGLAPLWTLLFTLPFMSAVQEMCARIAQVSGRGLAANMKKHMPRSVLASIVLLLVFANTVNIAANIGAMAAATQLLAPLPFFFLAIFFTVLTLVLEIFVSYKLYARYLKFLTLCLLSYVVVALIVTTDWMSVVSAIIMPTFSPSRDFFFILVAILGTTISPYLFFWQASSEVEEEIALGRVTLLQRRGASKEEIHDMRIDVISGMLFSNVVAFFVMLTAAVVLFPGGIIVETAEDAAMALAPVAGPFASLLFTVGIIGTGLLSIPVLAGSASYAVSEVFGWKSGLYRKLREAHGFYGVITIATLVGLMINAIGVNPIQLLLWTAFINGLVAPVILTSIMIIGNNKKIMGKWRNGRLSNVLNGLTLTAMVLSIGFLVVFWD